MAYLILMLTLLTAADVLHRLGTDWEQTVEIKSCDVQMAKSIDTFKTSLRVHLVSLI